MRFRSLAAVALCAALTSAVAGCGDDAEVFVASLAAPSGITSSATGTATFTLLEPETVSYTIDVSGITDVTASHIHDGAAGVSGPVIVGLFGGSFSGDGELVSGTFSAGADIGGGMTFDQLVEKMRAGTVYVNVHTTANPGGEIRGQIVLQ